MKGDEKKSSESVSLGAPSVAKILSLEFRGSRRVVLKRLDDDCLLDGQLHPSIRERLERVRELPLRGVANLLGVERGADDAVTHLVWEYVPGTPLEDVDGDEATWRRLCREVILAVQALHAAGIVHGAIHARNVIVDSATGEVRLTHVSPLLYNDADQDEADTIRMLRDLVASELPHSTLANDLDEADAAVLRLRDLYARLAEPAAARSTSADGAQASPNIRARAILLAAAAALAGIGIVVGKLWYHDWRLPA